MRSCSPVSSNSDTYFLLVFYFTEQLNEQKGLFLAISSPTYSVFPSVSMNELSTVVSGHLLCCVLQYIFTQGHHSYIYTSFSLHFSFSSVYNSDQYIMDGKISRLEK
jgi:hypothetical protein